MSLRFVLKTQITFPPTNTFFQNSINSKATLKRYWIAKVSNVGEGTLLQRRVSNLSLPTFMGVWYTLKWIFRIKIENLHIFAIFWVYPKGDIDMKGQQAVLLLLPNTATDVALKKHLWRPGTSWSLRNLNFSNFFLKKRRLFSQKTAFFVSRPNIGL